MRKRKKKLLSLCLCLRQPCFHSEMSAYFTCVASDNQALLFVVFKNVKYIRSNKVAFVLVALQEDSF